MPTRKDKNKVKVKEPEYTVFQKDSCFRGILKFKKALQICGFFYGEIEGDNTLFLTEASVIEANLNVQTLILEGKLTGNVIASKRVELKHGSVLIGDVKTPKLEISEGVIFEGQCEMKTNIETVERSDLLS